MSKQKKHLKPYQLFLIGLGVFLIRLFILAPLLPKTTAFYLLLNVLDISVVVFWIVAIVTAIRNRTKKTASKVAVTASNGTAVKDIDDYAGTLLYMSATAAEKLRQAHNLTDNQGSQLMMQVIGFCLINLVRQADGAAVPRQNTKTFIEDTLRIVAQRAGTDNEHDAYGAYKSSISELLDKFGDLPLKHDSGKQGGTLLWEYGKYMSETIGKSKDLEQIMQNVSVITTVNSSIDTKLIVQSLR